jgi:hypothetical protein
VIHTLQEWHRIVASRNLCGLDDLLADTATFHSPVLHTPQAGKALVKMYLAGAMMVLGNDTFRYLREVSGPRDAVLEFTATVDGIVINGVDMIAWDDDGRITDFKVMLRPLKAIQLVQQKMAEALQGAKK